MKIALDENSPGRSLFQQAVRGPMRIGANYLGNGKCEFVVWAPLLKNVALKIESPKDDLLPMTKSRKGYWRVHAKGILPGTLYSYRLDDKTDRPDPASRIWVSILSISWMTP